MWNQNDKLWSIQICNNAEWGEARKFLRMISKKKKKKSCKEIQFKCKMPKK